MHLGRNVARYLSSNILTIFDSLLLVSTSQAGLGVHLLYLGEEDGTEYAENSDEAVNLSYLRW